MMTISDGGPAFPHWCEVCFTGKGDATLKCHGGMSLRTYAAIKLQIPKSGIDWLDAMIRESRRNELAGRIVQGLCVGCAGFLGSSQEFSAYAKGSCNAALVERACILADRLLAASETGKGGDDGEA